MSNKSETSFMSDTNSKDIFFAMLKAIAFLVFIVVILIGVLAYQIFFTESEVVVQELVREVVQDCPSSTISEDVVEKPKRRRDDF